MNRHGRFRENLQEGISAGVERRLGTQALELKYLGLSLGSVTYCVALGKLPNQPMS